MFKKERINRQLIFVMILLLFPLTAFILNTSLGQKSYYAVSVFYIIYALIPFLLIFEEKRPRAREVLLISSMSAIAVISRTMFFMVPQFKPMTAIVIISGASLGGEAGFLIGIVSAFVSNFFVGQGQWTIYQMAALGIIGFLAGKIFNNKKFNKLKICIFGFFATLVIYGGIVNLGTGLIVLQSINMKGLLVVYGAGFPFDFIHAVSTVVFLCFLEKPFIKKIVRVKTKYGLIRNED